MTGPALDAPPITPSLPPLFPITPSVSTPTRPKVASLPSRLHHLKDCLKVRFFLTFLAMLSTISKTLIFGGYSVLGHKSRDHRDLRKALDLTHALIAMKPATSFKGAFLASLISGRAATDFIIGTCPPGMFQSAIAAGLVM